MQLSFKTPLWFYQVPVDFRKQLDGLSILVADQLSMNPTTGELFIFRSRRSNKIKLLWYETNGFWLCYKRLDKGSFKFPKNISGSLELTREELSWLLSGLNFTEHKKIPIVKASKFF